jgi:recombination protein RecA
MTLPALGWRTALPPETVSTGVSEADRLTEGCPRGRITEILGPVSSGRTTMLHAILAAATRRGEFCAVIDVQNSFDPVSACEAGVALAKLVWIRCSGNAEHALRTADLLIHGGGFGVVALDLAGLDAAAARRIPQAYWFRFRRAVEDTPTVLVVLGQEPQARSCAALLLEMQPGKPRFGGQAPFALLEDIQYRLTPRKPLRAAEGQFAARALAEAV